MQMQIERLRFSQLTAVVMALVIFGAGILVGMSLTGRSATAGTMSAPPLTAEQMSMGGTACPMMKDEAAPADTAKPQAEGVCPMMKDASGGKDEASVAATAKAPAKAPAADYICPMDPDVHASKPGRCPKCGMNLVKKTR